MRSIAAIRKISSDYFQGASTKQTKKKLNMRKKSEPARPRDQNGTDSFLSGTENKQLPWTLSRFASETINICRVADPQYNAHARAANAQRMVREVVAGDQADF